MRRVLICILCVYADDSQVTKWIERFLVFWRKALGLTGYYAFCIGELFGSVLCIIIEWCWTVY